MSTPSPSTSSAQANFQEIPVVDLARWRGSAEERAGFAAELRDICHHVGFFLVVNHGIERAFLDDLFTMVERLFALPEEQKATIDKHQSRHFRGWERVGSEFTNNRPDLREQVDFWSERAARDPSVEPHYLRLLGPNQWLSEELLPRHRELTLGWFEKAGALASQIQGILSVGLGLAEGHIESLFGSERMSLVKLIRYPETPPGGAGVNAHHDAGFLTVLAPGPIRGLEVENARGDWIPVDCPPDALVINLGEMLQGMTGNYYVATPHRVIASAERHAVGYFHGPSLDTTLDVLPLSPELAEAVAASPRHSEAGFMARREETEAGVGDMASDHKPATYGEQLWNYFSRSYPQLVAHHYPEG